MPAPKLEKHPNGVWYIHWTDGRRSKTASTRAKDLVAAKSFFSQWLLLEQEAPGLTGDTLTVAELWSVYFKRHVQRENASPLSTEWAWKNLKPHFGELLPGAIDNSVVEAYEARRLSGKIGKTSVASTVRRELALLRACLNWCAESGKGQRALIDKTILPSFKLPAAADPRERWLRHDEVQRLLDAAADMRAASAQPGPRRGKPEVPRMSRGERFLWLALETAARKGAIYDLTWDRVDFETNVIHYDVPGRRKTKKRRASVPISRALRPVLDRAYSERLNDGLVMDNKGEVWKTVQRVAARAKVADVSPHVLRHTAATHMARRGVPLWIISRVLGNTLAMVEKVYAKHAPDDLRAAVDMISGGILEAAE